MKNRGGNGTFRTFLNKIVQWLTDLFISFNCKAPDPNLGGLKNQEKIFQFSAAPDQLPNMRCQFYLNELLNSINKIQSYLDHVRSVYK